MNYRAARTTRVDLSTDRTVASNTVTVFGIIVANGSANGVDIEFQDASGSVAFNIVVPCNDTRISDIEFLADGGLAISGVGSSDVIVSVFHSHEGA